MQTWFTRKTCRLCDSGLRRLIRLKPTPLANEYVAAPRAQKLYPLSLMQCKACGHVQLGEVVSPKVLYSDYRYKSGISSSFVRHLHQLAGELNPGGFVIEIGSNDGTLLREFQRLGNDVLGIDPAASHPDMPQIQDCFGDSLANDIKPYNPPAALIVALNVLAHVDDLRGVMRGVSRLLADDGLFVFEVQYLGDLVFGNHWDMIYHEHLDYHHIKPLAGFLASEGLHIHAVRHVDTQGGSIRVYARKSPSDWVCPKEDIDISGFIERLKHVRNPLAKISGTVAGYGAPAKATTFMYQTGARVDFIVDDTPEKQGMFTPGLNIPIVSPAELPLRKPDFVFPLAWNFADELRAKHPELNWVSP